MAVTSNIQLYETLKQSHGNKQAEALVEYVDAKLIESQEATSKNYVTKEDLKEMELRLMDRISGLSLTISETKTGTVRWVFALFVALMLSIIGLYFRK